MEALLKDIRVIDFGRYIAGPYCSALLADFGAEVIRVEKKDGREDRTLIPLARNEDGSPREGAMFLQMNRGKKSLTLDPMHERGREVVRRLIRSADVVVANLPGDTLTAMGLDWPTVHALNPRTILAATSAFGLDGPYARRVGFDGVTQAMSGATHYGGWPEQPVRAAAPYVDFGTASLMAFGVMAALRAREQTGEGQLVEGALLRTAMTFFSTMLIEEHALHYGRTPTLNRSQTAAPSDIYRAKDGWLTVAVNGDPLFRRVCKLIGAIDWLADPRFGSDADRGTHSEIISERINSWCALRTRDEAIAAFEEARVPAGPVYTMAEALSDPHVRACELFRPVNFPGLPPAVVADTPVRLHGTPGQVRGRPPLLGEHSDTVLGALGYSSAEIAELRAAGAI
jgi:crotonobetainyl-CoA:carnitine CoA-transferase CaiB-like acyl-CoA transferase